MSTLFLVRHGQASFFSDNYDRLSDIGRVQARRLAGNWLARGIRFGRVYTGPRQRQIDTAEEVGQIFRQAKVPWSDPVVLDELDEYAAEQVLEQALPELIETDARIRDLHARVTAAETPAEKQRTFQRMYEVVMTKWASGELPLKQVESWPDFRRRVHRGLDRIVSADRHGMRVAAFTSGGPVGVAVERATRMPHEVTLRIAWMVRNGSSSQFLFSGERFTMSTFNALGHLDDDPTLLTYR